VNGADGQRERDGTHDEQAVREKECVGTSGGLGARRVRDPHHVRTTLPSLSQMDHDDCNAKRIRIRCSFMLIVFRRCNLVEQFEFGYIYVAQVFNIEIQHVVSSSNLRILAYRRKWH
jgi:hypothetical protein